MAAIRMTRVQVIKLNRLLDMKYKPAEIADEIGVTVETVYRSYLRAGCPFEKDTEGNIWIKGRSFKQWALETCQYNRAKKPAHPLEDGQAWCMRCNGPVEILNPKVKTVNRYLEMLQGTCQICGGKVNRARAAQPAGPDPKTAKAEKANGKESKA